jgi:hypothetical protein
MFDSRAVALVDGDIRVLRELAGKVAPVVLAGDQLVPVSESVQQLLPGGALRRGTVISVEGPPGAGSTSLLFRLVAAASNDGSWVALVGMPDAGLLAAAEAGVSLERVAVIPEPGGHWPLVTAALLDAIDLVVVRPSTRVRAQDARRLATRARDRGGVLLVAGAWPARQGRWEGLADGHGFLRARTLDVVTGGRGAAARQRRFDVAV